MRLPNMSCVLAGHDLSGAGPCSRCGNDVGDHSLVLRCRLGGHSWAEASCRCRRCGSSRGHVWHERCQCHRCGETREHSWQGCRCERFGCRAMRDAEHQWNACQCRACGMQRDEEHAWDFCRCVICQKSRDAEHDWDHCRCRICWTLKRDAEHDWDRCKCRACSKVRDSEHDWDGCKCRVCLHTRDEEHDWSGCRCRRCDLIDHDLPGVKSRPRLLDPPAPQELKAPIEPYAGPIELYPCPDLWAPRFEPWPELLGVDTRDPEAECKCRRCGEYAHEMVRIPRVQLEMVGHRTGTPQHPGPWVSNYERVTRYYSRCRRCGFDTARFDLARE